MTHDIELDWTVQIEEIQALESIFPDDFEIVSVSLPSSCSLPPDDVPDRWTAALLSSLADEYREQNTEHIPTWTISFQLAIHPTPPPPPPSSSSTTPWTIATPSSSSTHHHLSHLPPILLSVDLSPGYPSSTPSPPVYRIHCMALSSRHRSALERHLASSLVEEQGGIGVPICWTWADWLQNNALPEYCIVDGVLHLSVDDANVDDDDDDDQDTNNNRIAERRLMSLIRYSAAREAQLFRESSHTCHICFEDLLGRHFIKLDCGHHFCRTCLSEQSRIHVESGSLEALKCPDTGCAAAFSVPVLRSLLPPTLFQRWEALTLQRALDQMPDASYCPRCQTLSLEDVEENTADCPKCFYVFCTLCLEGRHPGVNCVSAETKLAMLRRKAEGGGAAAVEELRKKEHDMMSLAEIEKSSKPCPCCGMAIQRTEGCNKMVCTHCSAAWCYKCGKQIFNGYDHYKQSGEGGASTRNCVLFDEEEILRWERRFGWGGDGMFPDQQQQHEGMAQHRREAAAFRNDYLVEEFGRGGGEGRDVREGRLRHHHGVGARMGGNTHAVIHCPSCGQLNYRIQRNNHVHCWACSRHSCAVCRVLLPRRGGGAHFQGKGACPQHS